MRVKRTIRWTAVVLVATSFGWLTLSSPKRGLCQTDTVKTDNLQGAGQGEGLMRGHTQAPKAPLPKVEEPKEEDMGCGC